MGSQKTGSRWAVGGLGALAVVLLLLAQGACGSAGTADPVDMDDGATDAPASLDLAEEASPADLSPPDAPGEIADAGPGPATPGDPFAVGHFLQVELTLDDGVLATWAEDHQAHVVAPVTIDGVPVPSVGVSLIKTTNDPPAIAGKPTLKLEFDAADPDQTLAGTRTLWLRDMGRDPGKVRDMVATTLLRDLGLPSPRAVHAWVRVNGEERGLYLAVEALDEPAFLAHWFADPSGPLYTTNTKIDLVPESVLSFDHRAGEDPLNLGLRNLTLALDVLEADPGEDPMAALDALLNLDGYLTMVAAEILLGHKRGYALGPVRYGLYRDPADGRWTFLTHGFDRSLKDGVYPFDAKGRIQSMCTQDVPCRVALKQRMEEVAQHMDDMGLADLVVAARPFVLDMAALDPFLTENLEAVANGLDQTEGYIRSNPGWVLANLGCANPQWVDADGDGWSGCGADCDDDDPDVHPEAPELCNLADDDCNGVWDDGPECAPCVAWESVGGDQYDLCFQRTDWASARATCVERGGDLASVHSDEAQAALADATFSLWWTEWWIGLEDMDEEGVYVWSDGSPADYTAWANGEPNNSGDEDCTHFSSWAWGLWNDIPCDREQAFLCAYP